MSVASNVAQARKRLAAARTIERNQRLGRYNGRNSLSTEGTLDRHYGAAAVALDGLDRSVKSDVYTEHELAERVAVNAEQGQRRPELRARLADVRRRLRAAA